jgi:thioredoxin reductase (NADPH)
MPELPTDVNIAIVGAGPIGLELAVALKRRGLDPLHLEAGRLGETICRYPRGTRFLSDPEDIAIAGVPIHSPGQDRPSAEDYLAYLRMIAQANALDIHFRATVTQLTPYPDGLDLSIRTPLRAVTTRARRVILATGDMARTNRLGVPGEDHPHVHHHYDDPHAFFGRRVVVVGGRNSALEAAIRLFRAGARVALVHRRPLETDRISHKLYPVLEELVDNDRISLHESAAVTEILPTGVKLCQTDPAGQPDGRPTLMGCDEVLVLAGYASDTSLMESAGVQFAPAGPPQLDPRTMETSVPGLYVAGTAAARP